MPFPAHNTPSAPCTIDDRWVDESAGMTTCPPAFTRPYGPHARSVALFPAIVQSRMSSTTLGRPDTAVIVGLADRGFVTFHNFDPAVSDVRNEETKRRPDEPSDNDDHA